METTTKTMNYVSLLSLSNKELVQEVKNLIEIIENKSNKFDWQIKGNIKLTDTEMFELINNKRNVSTNAFKDFVYSLYRASLKQTKRSFNSFLNKLSPVDKIKIETGLKEKAIRDKRKKFKELEKLTELARLDYRSEKGNFYKLNS